MTDTTPSFVLRQGASAVDWVERDDRLVMENQLSSYDERNQRDWWERNRKIRELFADMEKKVLRLITAGEIPSATLLSWSALSRKLTCDRATLQHPRRKYWVVSRRSELLNLIENAKQQARLSHESAQPEVSDLEHLKLCLSAQRTQTGIVYDRCVVLEQEISQLRRLLALRDARIKELLTSNHNHNQQLAN